MCVCLFGGIGLCSRGRHSTSPPSITYCRRGSWYGAFCFVLPCPTPQSIVHALPLLPHQALQEAADVFEERLWECVRDCLILAEEDPVRLLRAIEVIETEDRAKR